MQVQYHKSFKKQLLKLQPTQVQRLRSALKLFETEPQHPQLYNHALLGEWSGYRSIAFGGDWRAHFKLVDGVAIFVAVGTHSQLYK
jgi:addiction module RelE/StbE family toxin